MSDDEGSDEGGTVGVARGGGGGEDRGGGDGGDEGVGRAHGGGGVGGELSTVMLALCDVGNAVMRPDAISRLGTLRETHGALFSEREVFLATHSLLARYRLPLHVRQSLHALVAPAAPAFTAPSDRQHALAEWPAASTEGLQAAPSIQSPAIRRVSAVL